MRDTDASIVVADARHVPGWLVLRTSLWPDETAGEHAAAVDLSLARSSDRIGFVALAHDAVVGFAEASIRREYVNGCETVPVAFLEGLFVMEGHRRCGLARTLCAAVEEWSRAQGMGELGSDAENADGLAFHAGAGFTETERVVFFRKPL